MIHGTGIPERNESRIDIGKENKSKISFRLKHELDPEVYNLALTLKLTLEQGFAAKQITQAGKRLKTKQTGNDLFFDVTPNGGEVVMHLEK